MQNRRTWMQLAAALVANQAVGAWGNNTAVSEFDSLFELLLSDPARQTGGNDREGRISAMETRAIAPQLPPSKTPVSDKAAKVIVFFEVTSGSVYQKKFQRPVVPAVNSGVTIGIGYDLGYVKPEWLYEDWQDYLEPDTLRLLEPVCRLTGRRASASLVQVKEVTVPWNVAYSQFRKNLLPRYVAETEHALPNTRQLSPDSLGALVSLVYNRGPSFRNPKPRFAEMRRIRSHMERERFELIPSELLDMRHLWENVEGAKGLVARRELEAALFKQGLRNR